MFQYKNKHKDLYVNAKQIDIDNYIEISDNLPIGYSIQVCGDHFDLYKDDKFERYVGTGDYIVIHNNVVTVMPDYVFNDLFV